MALKARVVAVRTLEAAMIFVGVLSILTVYALRQDVAGPLALVALVGGQATLTAVTLAVRNHTVSVRYVGSNDYQAFKLSRLG